jgi:hypothetical protein
MNNFSKRVTRVLAIIMILISLIGVFGIWHIQPQITENLLNLAAEAEVRVIIVNSGLD